MIVCRDCKYLLDDAGDLFCEMRSYQGFLHFPEQTSCIHAERADELQVCCRDCKQFKCVMDDGKCQKGHWIAIIFDLDKMSCPEWAPREEKACKFQGLCGECLINKWDCPNREVQTHELRDKPDLTRIADALEKIARELEKQNKLKALSFRKDSYVELDEVDEIMEG